MPYPRHHVCADEASLEGEDLKELHWAPGRVYGMRLVYDSGRHRDGWVLEVTNAEPDGSARSDCWVIVTHCPMCGEILP
jgi:hypothetical protein